MFAAGDIIDWKEEKQAVRAMAHASIVANNIVAFINENNAGFKQYKGTANMIVVTNGRVGSQVTHVGLITHTMCLNRMAVLLTLGSCGVFLSVIGL